MIIWLSEMSACFVLHNCFPFSLPSLGQVIMHVRLVLVSWEQTRSSMLPENLCLFCDPHLLALYLSCNEHSFHPGMREMLHVWDYIKA